MRFCRFRRVCVLTGRGHYSQYSLVYLLIYWHFFIFLFPFSLYLLADVTKSFQKGKICAFSYIHSDAWMTSVLNTIRSRVQHRSDKMWPFFSLLVLFPNGAAQDYIFKNVDCLKTHTCYDHVKNDPYNDPYRLKIHSVFLLIVCMKTGVCSSRCFHNSLKRMWKTFTWLYRHLCCIKGTFLKE